MVMNTEELKRLAEAVLKAYGGLSWQVTMVRDEHGVTHYHIRSHSEPGIAVIKDQYWEDDHIPPVDHYGYIQPDDRMDCDVFRVDIARLIAAANPAAILELISEIDSLRDEANGLTGELESERKRLDFSLNREGFYDHTTHVFFCDRAFKIPQPQVRIETEDFRATIDELMGQS